MERRKDTGITGTRQALGGQCREGVGMGMATRIRDELVALL